ncbi:type 2 isopentenyl-diphosphate Delta-isomerase [Methanopyrus sp.]
MVRGSRAEGTRERKWEHVLACVWEDVESEESPLFDCVKIVHRALPELDFDDVDMEVELFGKRLSFPLIIAGMTGGHPKTGEINRKLARVARELEIGIGVGSQRAGVEDPEVRWTFEVVREEYPDGLVLANIGLPQLRENGPDLALEVVDMVDADALAVHVNVLQEAVQLEGEADAAGFVDVLAEVCEAVDVPVILKETGAGVSAEDAELVRDIVDGIDVGGAGGTNWAVVEAVRSKAHGEAPLGYAFSDWGVPTAASVLEVRSVVGNDLVVIGTGGVRTGMDVAKVLALGADCAGMALPVLRKVLAEGVRGCVRFLESIAREVKIAMLMAGCSSVEEMGSVPIVVHGKLREWLECRGVPLDLVCTGDRRTGWNR